MTSTPKRSHGRAVGTDSPSAAQDRPYVRWTLQLMRYPPQVVVEAQSFEDAKAEAQKQLEAWVSSAQWSGWATGATT